MAGSPAAQDGFGVELTNTVYALDSTTIDLCLALFPWAKFRQAKGAVKLHTLLDLRGSIPSFIHITEGKLHDVNILDRIAFEAGSFYVMDRGYIDFARIHTLHQAQAFFVVRAKSNLQFRWVYSRPVDKETGLRCDQTVRLTTPKSGCGPGQRGWSWPGCLVRAIGQSAPAKAPGWKHN